MELERETETDQNFNMMNIQAQRHRPLENEKLAHDCM